MQYRNKIEAVDFSVQESIKSGMGAPRAGEQKGARHHRWGQHRNDPEFPFETPTRPVPSLCDRDYLGTCWCLGRADRTSIGKRRGQLRKLRDRSAVDGTQGQESPSPPSLQRPQDRIPESSRPVPRLSAARSCRKPGTERWNQCRSPVKGLGARPVRTTFPR